MRQMLTGRLFYLISGRTKREDCRFGTPPGHPVTQHDEIRQLLRIDGLDDAPLTSWRPGPQGRWAPTHRLRAQASPTRRRRIRGWPRRVGSLAPTRRP